MSKKSYTLTDICKLLGVTNSLVNYLQYDLRIVHPVVVGGGADRHRIFSEIDLKSIRAFIDRPRGRGTPKYDGTYSLSAVAWHLGVSYDKMLRIQKIVPPSGRRWTEADIERVREYLATTPLPTPRTGVQPLPPGYYTIHQASVSLGVAMATFEIWLARGWAFRPTHRIPSRVYPVYTDADMERLREIVASRSRPEGTVTIAELSRLWIVREGRIGELIKKKFPDMGVRRNRRLYLTPDEVKQLEAVILRK